MGSDSQLLGDDELHRESALDLGACSQDKSSKTLETH